MSDKTPVPTAHDHTDRVVRPLGIPSSTSAGHTFTSAPSAANAPHTRVERDNVNREMTANAVTCTS